MSTSIFVSLRPSLYNTLLDSQADRALRGLGEVIFWDQERNPTGEELADRVAGVEAVVTGWGTPRFTDQVLAAADRLRIIVHSAGSIKHILPPAVFERGITVSHVASAIAPAVAEMSLTLTLMLLRRAHELDPLVRTGEWNRARELGMGGELAGRRVGVVGAGYTGRSFIKMLRALEAEVWVYDPYLSAERAEELGVRKVELDELFAGCSVVSIQAPSTPETHHMIGARQLALMPDGAIFINTARSWVVDYDALLEELRRGRIRAALDVFDAEPLSPDHPLCKLDNVFLTPHVAGATKEARRRQGRFVVEELTRFFSGQPLKYPVTLEMLSRMA